MNKLKHQAGLTLVELLAAVVLVSVISIMLFSLITSAMDNNKAIQEENAIRDEADLMMAQIIKALYSTNQYAIVNNSTTNNQSHIKVTDATGCQTVPGPYYKNTTNCINSFLEISSDSLKCNKNESGNFINFNQCVSTLSPIGFSTNNNETKLYILGEVITPMNRHVKILPTSKIIGDPANTSNYQVELELEYTKTKSNGTKTKKIKFMNEIQPIVNANGI